MARRTGLISALLLALSPALQAQESFVASLLNEADRSQWRQVDADMSPVKYQDALRHNRGLARNTLRNSVVSLGVPKTAVNLMGAAAALAVDDLELNLNKSKTLALQIESAADRDRSALIRIKLDW